MSTDSIAAQQRLFDPGRQVTLSLADRFLVPPFTVLDAKQRYWQDRKKDWLSLGIKSELGRDQKLLGYESLVGNEAYGKKGKIEITTSIFDPVVCEVVYRWFCPPGGTVLDPFAGGSVRGIVAAALGRGYLGIDLRQEQVEANYEQRGLIGGRHPLEPAPEWVIGDSRDLLDTIGGHRFDAVFSCPPYYDLEVYSDDPRDLSNASDYPAFRTAYAQIISATVEAMKPNTFATFVVGDVRDKEGNYVQLVADTTKSFCAAGASFYNDAILTTMLGTTPVRVSSQFGAGRKMGKVHQNVLVFCKGDPRKAAERIPVDEVAIEQGGATWRADGTAVVDGSSEVTGDEPDIRS